MPYNDLRSYLDALEAAGQLSRVSESCDWDLEVGALSRVGLDRHGPALLFENVKDYKGYWLLANLLGATTPVHGRMAMAMDLPLTTPTMDIVREFARRMKNLIPPVRVTNAPCKEVVLKGDEIDLTRFPAPLIHAMDGGRYLGTWHVDVTRDPDSDWVNWGMYRHMLQGPKQVGWLANAAQHAAGLYLRKYEPRNVPMPFAIAIGTEPITSIVAASQIPTGVDEASVVGGVRGEAVQVIRCETLELDVPASAEIIIEGYVHPKVRALEGEFGEFTGYAAGGQEMRPFIQVTCVTHRRDPILTMSNMGKPWDESGIVGSITISAALTNELQDRGLSFSNVYSPPPNMAIVVGLPRLYPGYVQTVASAIWGSKPGIYRPYIFAVGDDVDVTSADDVMWCLMGRLHPENGVHVQRRTPALPLWPFLTASEREQRVGCKLLLDATFPPEWPDEAVPTIIDLEHAWPRSVADRALDKWRNLGL